MICLFVIAIVIAALTVIDLLNPSIRKNITSNLKKKDGS